MMKYSVIVSCICIFRHDRSFLLEFEKQELSEIIHKVKQLDKIKLRKK